MSGSEVFLLGLLLTWVTLLFVVVINVLWHQVIKLDAPYLPSQDVAIKTMIELSGIKPGERMAELGSGDGRVLWAFAKKGALCYGYEVNPVLVWVTRLKALFVKNGENVKVYTKNFWKEDLASYDVITIYGFPHKMGKLEEKLCAEKRDKPVRVVSNKFPFPKTKPTKQKDTVYLYVVS